MVDAEYYFNHDIISIIVDFLDCCDTMSFGSICTHVRTSVINKIKNNDTFMRNKIIKKNNIIHCITRNDYNKNNNQTLLNSLMRIKCCKHVSTKWIMKYRYLLHNILNSHMRDSRPFIFEYHNDFHKNLQTHLNNLKTFSLQNLYYSTLSLLTMYGDNIYEIYKCYLKFNLNTNILIKCISNCFDQLTFKINNPTEHTITIPNEYYKKVKKTNNAKINNLVKLDKTITFSLYDNIWKFNDTSFLYQTLHSMLLSYIKNYTRLFNVVCQIHCSKNNKSVNIFCRKLNETSFYENLYIFRYTENELQYYFNLFN